MNEQKTLTLENFVSPIKEYIEEQLTEEATEVEVLKALYGNPAASGTNLGTGANATYPASYEISAASQTFTITATESTTVTNVTFEDSAIEVSGLVATIPAKYHKPLVFTYISTAI